MEDGHKDFYALNKFLFFFFLLWLCYLVVVETAQCCNWSDSDKNFYSLETSCTSQEVWKNNSKNNFFWSGDNLRARHHNIDVLLRTRLKQSGQPCKISFFLPLIMGCLLGWDVLGEHWHPGEVFMDIHFFPAGPFCIPWMPSCWDGNMGNAPWCQILSVHPHFSLCYAFSQCFQLQDEELEIIICRSSVCTGVFVGVYLSQ